MGNTLKTTFLLAVLTVLFVLVGKAIGGQSGMVFAFGLAVVMNVGSYWFSDKIVLRMYNAREVTESESPQLHGMVRRLALAAGLPMPQKPPTGRFRNASSASDSSPCSRSLGRCSVLAMGLPGKRDSSFCFNSVPFAWSQRVSITKSARCKLPSGSRSVPREIGRAHV